MTSTAELFKPQDVLLNMKVSYRQELFEAVANVWATNHGADANRVVRCLDEREILGSTGLGQGVAIPHARSGVTKETLSAFVRPKSPMDFDAPDGVPVDCFVFLFVPEAEIHEHLKRLGQIAKQLSGSEFRNKLRAASSPEQVHRLFTGESF